MKKTYFLTLLSALYTTSAISATPTPTCEPMPSCADLGYSATISDSCENILSCPFDTNYQVCLDTPDPNKDCAIGDIYYSDGTCGSTDNYDSSKVAVGVVFVLTDKDGNFISAETSNHGRVVNLHDLWAQEDYLFDPQNPYSGTYSEFPYLEWKNPEAVYSDLWWSVESYRNDYTNRIIYGPYLRSYNQKMNCFYSSDLPSSCYNGAENISMLFQIDTCPQSHYEELYHDCVFPAMQATYAFYPPNVSAKHSKVGATKWYLPGAVELIYLYGELAATKDSDYIHSANDATKIAVNKTLSFLNSKLGSAYATTLTEGHYMAANYQTWSHYTVNMSNGQLSTLDNVGTFALNIYYHYIRAFLAF